MTETPTHCSPTYELYSGYKMYDFKPDCRTVEGYAADKKMIWYIKNNKIKNCCVYMHNVSMITKCAMLGKICTQICLYNHLLYIILGYIAPTQSQHYFHRAIHSGDRMRLQQSCLIYGLMMLLPGIGHVLHEYFKGEMVSFCLKDVLGD